jgi:hypothetical protein
VPFDAVEIDLAYLWGPAVSEAAGR